MPKPPNNWPPGALPARMDAACAAFYLGIGKTTFLEGVAAGIYPPPVHARSRKLWLTSHLLAAVDSAAPGAQSTTPTDEELLNLLDNDNPHPRR